MNKVVKTLLITMMGVSLTSCSFLFPKNNSSNSHTNSSEDKPIVLHTNTPQQIMKIGESFDIDITDEEGYKWDTYFDFVSSDETKATIGASGYFETYVPGEVTFTATAKESIASAINFNETSFAFTITIEDRTDVLYMFFKENAEDKGKLMYEFTDSPFIRDGDYDKYYYDKSIRYSPFGDSVSISYKEKHLYSNTDTHQSWQNIHSASISFTWNHFEDGNFYATFESNSGGYLTIKIYNDAINFLRESQTITLNYDRTCATKTAGNLDFNQFNNETNITSFFSYTAAALDYLNEKLDTYNAPFSVF